MFAEGEEYLTADDQINGQSNPYAWIDEYQDLVDIENLRMSTSLDAKISNSLTFRTRIGTQYRNTHRQMYFSSNHNRGRQSNGEGHKFTRKDESVVLDNLIFYKSELQFYLIRLLQGSIFSRRFRLFFFQSSISNWLLNQYFV